MSPVAWITGAGGLIGSHLVKVAPPAWKPRAIARSEIELTNPAAVRAAFEYDRPQLIIHCAALSKTLDCERDPGAAWTNNLEVTRTLTELAANIPLLSFSSDLVFDGQKGNYTEDDTPHPLSVYAESKLAAERAVLANPRHSVIRTSLNAGRTRGASAFNEQWLGTLRRGGTLDLKDAWLPRGSEAVTTGCTALVDVERRHIVQVLESCRWRIEGLGGAAQALAMKASTLRSRMLKLGIGRPR